MLTTEQIISQTKKWIDDVVIACNFCPFARNAVKQQTIHYQVETSRILKDCLNTFLEEMIRLENDSNIETTFIIFPNSFQQFDDYLNFVFDAEHLLKLQGHEGVYQLASFHPLYKFADSSENDAADYTNRSVYPMLHLLREESIEKALLYYNNPENIPKQNINFAREKGLIYMKMLRDSCLKN
jgi:uncharacterized protein